MRWPLFGSREKETKARLVVIARRGAEHRHERESSALKVGRAVLSSTRQLLIKLSYKARRVEFAATAVGLATLVSFSGYWALNRDVVLVTGRSRTMGVPVWLERIVGDSLAADFANLPGVAPPLVQTINDLVRPLSLAVNELAPVGHPVRALLPPGDWGVLVVRDDAVNAVCLPGGHVVVFEGLVEFASRACREGKLDSAADAVAFVLAHEIAHTLARHGAEKMSWFPIQVPFYWLSLDSRMLRSAFAWVLTLPHSRLVEAEADAIAVAIVDRAGFDVREGAKLLELFSGRQVMDWLSTHPSGVRRRRDIEERLEARQSDRDLGPTRDFVRAIDAAWAELFFYASSPTLDDDRGNDGINDSHASTAST